MSSLDLDESWLACGVWINGISILSFLNHALIHCLKILKYLFYPRIMARLKIVAMPIIIVYMYIDIYIGMQGRIAYVLIVTPSKMMYKINE